MRVRSECNLFINSGLLELCDLWEDVASNGRRGTDFRMIRK